jgi:putative phage-type endonuclease
MPLINVKQGSAEWLEARRGLVTASIAACCLGLDPNRGPLAAYNEILGLKTRKQSSHMAWGNRNEDEAVRIWEELTGELAFQTGFWIHDEYGWLGASPDRLVGEDGMLEVKCPINTIPELVPDAHFVQIQIQMACTGRKWCDWFACQSILEGGKDKCVRIPADPHMQADLIARLALFFIEHIYPKMPPPRRRTKGRKDERAGPSEKQPSQPAPELRRQQIPAHD